MKKKREKECKHSNDERSFRIKFGNVAILLEEVIKGLKYYVHIDHRMKLTLTLF